MSQFDDFIRNSISQEDIPMPENFQERTQATLDSLPIPMTTTRRRVMPRLISAAACFFFAFFLLLPNISPVYANAASQIPVIGTLVELFTIREYAFSDSLHELDAQAPAVSIPGQEEAENLLNQDVQALTDAIVDRFYATLEEGPNSVHVDYEAVTNTEDWFTLKLMVSEAQASGNNWMVFYHINRQTGAYVSLGDLITQEGLSVLAQEVQAQMTDAMAANETKAYFLEDVGSSLAPNQNFYFTDNQDLVIVYNEYEVAPGFMGNPSFTIPASVYQPFLAS